MAEETSAKRIDVVFDVYRSNSIINIEWVENRSCTTTTLRFNQILPTHKIQKWWESLKGPENKKFCKVSYFRVERRELPWNSSI